MRYVIDPGKGTIRYASIAKLFYEKAFGLVKESPAGTLMTGDMEPV